VRGGGATQIVCSKLNQLLWTDDKSLKISYFFRFLTRRNGPIPPLVVVHARNPVTSQSVGTLFSR
jgi:hypothetical protein